MSTRIQITHPESQIAHRR